MMYVKARCPVCGAEVEVALTPELLAEAGRAGVARAVAQCPRGHAVVLSVDQRGEVRAAAPAHMAARPDCELTDKAPPSLRPRLQAIIERGAATEADALLLERARRAGWVIC